MKPAERLYAAINREKPDRVPVVPKIWVDLAANLTETDLLEIVATPLTALNVILFCLASSGFFIWPKPVMKKYWSFEKKGAYFQRSAPF